MRLNTLMSGVLAYVLSLFTPILIYDSLTHLPIPDIILGLTIIAILGVVVGLESALITRNTVKATFTSIIGCLLGLLTPYISAHILQLSFPQELLIPLGKPSTYLIIPASPALAALISLAYLSVVKLKHMPVGEIEEDRQKLEGEGGKLETGEKEITEKQVVEGAEGGRAERMGEEVGAEGKVMEPSIPEHEPELNIIEEIVKEIEEEKEVGIMGPQITGEQILKKCKHCGEMIPPDSIYCPLCGGYQEE